MSNFLTVFSFEFKQFFKKKSTIVTFIIYLLLAFGITFIPTILNGNNAISNFFKADNENFNKSGYVVKDIYVDTSDLKDAKKYSSKEDLERDLREKKISEGIVLTKDKYQYISESNSLLNKESEFNKLFDEKIKKIFYATSGIDFDKVTKINSSLPKAEKIAVNNSDNSEQSSFNIIIVYIFSFVIYMTLIMFGSICAINIAKEKSNRAMELLVVTVKPKTLILAKVFSISLVALSQMLAIVLSFLIGIKINLTKYNDALKLIVENLDYKLVVVAIVFSVTGFLMMMFLYSAFSSLVSKIEEVNSVITIPMFLVIGAFFANLYVIGQSGVGKITHILSYVPFTSYYTMITRYATTKTSLTDLIISYTILLLTTVIIAFASIKVYRNATLRYGQKLNFFKILFKK